MSTGLAKSTPKEIQLEKAIDRPMANSINISNRSGLILQSMGEAMEFSKLMSLGKEGLPKHCRESPGMCLVICIQAMEWGMNPLALANKSYVVNDRLCYEASLYQSVVTRRAPIVGRIKMSYDGDGDKRTCRVWAELSDGTGNVEYVSPPFGRIQPKNSPLWKNDPDQQQFYFSVRAFTRRHFPDIMMGVNTVDELMDGGMVETVHTVDMRPKTERLADRLGATSSTQPADAVPGTTPESQSEATQEQDAGGTRSLRDQFGSAWEPLVRRIELCVNQAAADQIKAEIAEYLREDGLTQAGADDLLQRLSGDE